MDPGALGGFCGWRCPQGLAVRQSTEKAHDRQDLEHRSGQAVLGEKLAARGAEGQDVENLNWGYLQLGLIALAFGGLQVWWISSVFRKRDLARPLSEGEFRKTLEAIWKKEQRKG